MDIEKRKTTLYRYLNRQELLLKGIFSGKQKNTSSPWIKVTLRPVMIKGEEKIQFSFYDERKSIIKNFSGDDYIREVNKLLDIPFKNIFIETTAWTVQLQTSKKGKILMHEEKVEKVRSLTELLHNRQKNYVIPDTIPSDFLEVLGIMTKEGKVRAERQSKFKQLNGFLKIVDETFQKHPMEQQQKDFLGIDCGCGNAYLTLAIYNYFNYIRHIPFHMTGIDMNDELIQNHQSKVKELQWDKINFVTSKIEDYTALSHPDIVLALHACNTATDETIHKAIMWETKYIFVSPCCHHDIQQQIKNGKAFPAVYQPVFRYGALRERFCDILTDTLRTLILRIMGYQTDVIEFVSGEQTNRNLIIRAVKVLPPGEKKFVEEYGKLKTEWGITPYLETLLGKNLLQYIT